MSIGAGGEAAEGIANYRIGQGGVVSSKPKKSSGRNARSLWLFLHRYIGLGLAAFLFLEGVTGSLLAFNAEIAIALDPGIAAKKPAPEAQALEPAALLQYAEAAMPDARVGYFTPRLMDNQVVLRMVWKRGDVVHAQEPDFLILDPWTGKELGRRRFDEHWSGDFRRDFMPFIFMLHKNLALGDWGAWFMGLVALAWTIDCFVAFYLTLPLKSRDFWRHWKTAWQIKHRAGIFRLNFDLHRASGLWLWPMLFIFAWSSVQLDAANIYRLTMNQFFASDPTELMRTLYPPTPDVGPPKLDLIAAQARGRQLVEDIARAEGFHVQRPISMQYIGAVGRYNYSVLTDRAFPQDQRLTVFFDSNSGVLAGRFQTSATLPGDTISGWLSALHQIRDPVDYLVYRIFVCILGVVVAMLSATGVYIWWKKRRARSAHAHRPERSVFVKPIAAE